MNIVDQYGENIMIKKIAFILTQRKMKVRYMKHLQ